MAFVRLAFFPGGTAAHYQAVADALGDLPAPAGRIMFAAGPVDGGWQVVQAWAFRDQLDEFNRTVFLPALARLGSRGFPAPPRVIDFEPSEFVHQAV